MYNYSVGPFCYMWRCRIIAFFYYICSMKELKDRIMRDGCSLDGGILKVDSFINHQMDAALMMNIAKEFVHRFEGVQIDKVITVEASGIAPAIMVGYLLGKPVVFAKKSVPSTMAGMLTAEVFSFTKNRHYTICVGDRFVGAGDRLLFIDDFLANGNAALGIAEIARQAAAEIVGMGFIIEKSFQSGRSVLLERGFKVESLAIVESLDNCQIVLK